MSSSKLQMTVDRQSSTTTLRRRLVMANLSLQSTKLAARVWSDQFNIECECEADGRWLAEVPELPGALAYGTTADEAMARAEALALRALAERLEHGEVRPIDIRG